MSLVSKITWCFWCDGQNSLKRTIEEHTGFKRIINECDQCHASKRVVSLGHWVDTRYFRPDGSKILTTDEIKE